jgi:hypothetical protein
MGKEDFGYETTVRAVRGEDGHSHFARRFGIRDKLLAATLPALWALVVVVVVVVVARFWW